MARLNHIVSVSILMCVHAVTACVLPEPGADGAGGAGGSDDGDGEDGEDAMCFALDPQIYRASAKACQEEGERTLVVACPGAAPPDGMCGPAHRAIRPDLFFCCCDPRTDPSCDFVP
jgi:hypothetical protein